MSFLRHLISAVLSAAICASVIVLVAFNVVNSHMEDAGNLADAAREANYAQSAVELVEAQLNGSVSQFGIDFNFFDGAIEAPAGVYDEMKANIYKVYHGESTNVDTSAINGNIAAKLSGMPDAIVNSVAQIAAAAYTTVMSFDAVRPIFAEVYDFLDAMSVMNTLLPLIIGVSLIVIVIINRRHVSALLSYLGFPLLISGGALASAILFYNANITSAEGLASAVNAGAAYSQMGFVFDTLKIFADALVRNIAVAGLIIFIAGFVLLLAALIAASRRRGAY